MIILIKEFDFYLEVQFFFSICLLENDFENWSKKSMVKLTLVLDILENGS